MAQANLSQAIDALKEAGAWIIGLEGSEPPEGGRQSEGRKQAQGAVLSGQPKDPDEVRLDAAIGLVVGSEGEGMRPLTVKSCDILMKLPMKGQIESLNAAVAGSVALYLAYLARK